MREQQATFMCSGSHHLTTTSYTTRLHGVMRLASSRLNVLMAVVLAGCADGYPTDDEPHVSHHHMTQAQRLQAMNDVGAQARAGHGWSYELRAACLLQVHSRAPTGNQSFSVPLKDAEIGLRSRKDEDLFDVTLSVGRPPAHHRMVVLRAKKWTDAFVLRSLLQSLRRGCETDSA